MGDLVFTIVVELDFFLIVLIFFFPCIFDVLIISLISFLVMSLGILNDFCTGCPFPP